MEEVARASGQHLQASAVTLPGASLDDHWQDGRALRAIRSRRFDVVVLQQGPSTLPESRAALVASTRRFSAEIRKTGARPALLMVWPLPGQTFEAVAASYRAAAEEADTLLLPVGEAFGLALARDPALRIFGPDGFHPDPAGTWLAALTVACTLFPQETPVLPPSALLDGAATLTPAQRQLLAETACLAAPRRTAALSAGAARLP
ncbi:MAG TPA: hypothetical protein VMR21_02950 [Vicinamibacteria bacterium]|nr:hypothetical protein [Vicinamibacteria bacterium]